METAAGGLDEIRKLVLIEWLDAHRLPGESWKQLSDLQANGAPLRCRSVGWLVSDSDGGKVIVPHLSGDRYARDPYGAGEISIPDGAIVKMTFLQELPDPVSQSNPHAPSKEATLDIDPVRGIPLHRLETTTEHARQT